MDLTKIEKPFGLLDEDMNRRIKELEAKLAKAVEEAFFEGFCEGRDGDWVWGDPTPAWEKSDSFAELKGDSK